MNIVPKPVPQSLEDVLDSIEKALDKEIKRATKFAVFLTPENHAYLRRITKQLMDLQIRLLVEKEAA